MAIVIIMVLITVLGGILYVVLWSAARPEMHYVTGEQQYSGPVNSTEIFNEFVKAGFEPVGSIYNNSWQGRTFHPICGAPGSSNASKSKEIIRSGTLDSYQNVTGVKLRTNSFRQDANTRSSLEDTTRCILANIKSILNGTLNLKLTFEEMKYRQFTFPSFEAVPLLCAVTIACIILKYRRKGLLKDHLE